MRYLMKRQALSPTGGYTPYTVLDEKGRDAFRVGGRLGAAGKPGGSGDRLSIQDARGRELAFVRRAILPKGPAYEMYYADELHAVVRREQFNPSRCAFAVDLPGPDDLHAYGDFPGLEYAFTRDGQSVATVSRTWFRPANSAEETYSVEVAKGEDDLLILASTVVIDVCCDEAGMGKRAGGTGGTGRPGEREARRPGEKATGSVKTNRLVAGPARR